MKKLMLLAATVAVAACTPMPKRDPVVVKPTPICTSEKQCQAMWVEAQKAVTTASGMRIAQVTDSSIFTYPRLRSRSETMTGTVYKVPQADGTYRIEAEFQCGYDYCHELEKSALSLFNVMVADEGETFARRQKWDSMKPAKAGD